MVWLITAVMTGIGVLSYPVAWVIMPEEPAMVEVPSGYPATHLADCVDVGLQFVRPRFCGLNIFQVLMIHLKSDDADIAYEVLGSGPPLVLLASFSGAS